MKQSFLSYLTIGLACILGSCADDGELAVLDISDDVEIGRLLHGRLDQDSTVNLLAVDDFQTAYEYLNLIADSILASGFLTQADTFTWEIYIVNSSALNAFSFPGGKIYLNDGLIEKLENADQLAGVIAYEMAHIDFRHHMKRLQSHFSIEKLKDMAAGTDEDGLATVFGLLSGTGNSVFDFQYRRSDFQEADEASVNYLGGTPYACHGAALFFDRLSDRIFLGEEVKYLDLTPDIDERKSRIQTLADSQNCDQGLIQEIGTTFDDVKSSL